MTIETLTATVTSADGSTIATYVAGSGRPLVIVDPALGLARNERKLSAALESRFTVIRYDRRGRGGSSDSSPDTADPQHEVDDLAAVIAAHGGQAVLFGSSSGAVLALEAAARLADQVSGVVLYEPPFIVDDSRPALALDLPARIAADVAKGDEGKAVSAFFVEAVGVPRPAVAAMKLMPLWKDAKAIARTLRYDFALLAGTQLGEPLPADRWVGVTAPGVVMVGSKSEPFFHTGARALAEAVPTIRYEALAGGHHGSPQMDPDGLAARIIELFA